MHRCYLIVLASFVFMTAAEAHDAHTLRFKQPAKGTSFLVDKQEVRSVKIMPPGAAPVVKPNPVVTQVKQEYRETILETAQGPQAPPVVKRDYVQAEVTSNDATEKLKYNGKSVLITQKAGQYVYQIQGGEVLTGPDSEYLKEGHLNGGPGLHEIENWLLPKQPVKVNETWKPELPSLIQLVEKTNNMELEAEKCTATGKLVSVYKKGARQFGVISVHLEFVPRTLVIQNGKKIQAPPGNKIAADWKSDRCIDGSSLDGTTDVDLQIDAVLPIGADGKENITMKLSNLVKIKLTETQGN
jgi:hypothetical protein